MDDIRLFLFGIADKAEIVHRYQFGEKYLRFDAGSLCVLRELAVAQAYKGEVVVIFQPGAEGKNVGLCAALVASAGYLHYFHRSLRIVMIIFIIIYRIGAKGNDKTAIFTVDGF